MAYRNQEIRDLCILCKTPTDSSCLRCASPLCVQHVPIADQRCDACENDWLEISAGRALGRWRFASESLLQISKWSGFAGSVSLTFAVLLLVISPAALLELGALLLLVFLLSFPVCIASLIALPLVRMAERALDSSRSRDRRQFLEERSPDRQKQLATSEKQVF